MKKVHFDDYCSHYLLTRLCAWLREGDCPLIVREDDQRCFVPYILLVGISGVIWLVISAL